MTSEGMPNGDDRPDNDPVFDALEEVSRTLGADAAGTGEIVPAGEAPEVPDPVTQARDAMGGDQLEGAMDQAMDHNLRIEMLPQPLRASMQALRSRAYLPGELERYIRTAENAAAVLRAYPTADEIRTLRAMSDDERRIAMQRLERAGYAPAIGAGFSQSCELALWVLEQGGE